MLMFLTGDIQIGKTRWLSRQIETLSAGGVECVGVIAPGTWIQHDDGYDKTGIDNVLLPEGRKIPFARRRDLAQASGEYDAGSQATQAQLGWAISDDALQQVNAHFRHIADVTAPGKRLLVVDELGWLELERGEGLGAAVEILDRGATAAVQHAVVIVRKQLLPLARDRFARATWGGMHCLAPDDESARFLAATVA